jgi:hypothetical protein
MVSLLCFFLCVINLNILWTGRRCHEVIVHQCHGRMSHGTTLHISHEDLCVTVSNHLKTVIALPRYILPHTRSCNTLKL